MAFMYDLDVPTSMHPTGILEVQMDLSNGVFADFYEVNVEDFSDDDDETFDLAQEEDKKPLYRLQQDEETKQWKVVIGESISDEDLKAISIALTANLERWENSEW
ncbi:hypothetical protein SAMN05421813_12832 [Daejeonella rubra]|uniref:Uncharacterized protein n=2 Tax=Daejeonella rubra TaxID=990371 RepID=A0A1G9X2S9_9SPHI|nr:hypothetical protein SAMN05421813_12832 [Daejeonella rubra]